MDRQSLWWNTISGAVQFVQDSIEAVAASKVLLIEEPPYIEHYLMILQDRFRQWDSSLQFDIGTASDWATAFDIEETLMNRYAPQADYHPMDGSRAEYIAKKHLLSGRVLIVRKVEEYPEWLDVVIQYARNCSAYDGWIIVTFRGPSPLKAARRGVAELPWRTYISNYDMQLFASSCIAGAKLSLAARNYVTQIASRLAGADPERCEQLAIHEIVEEDAPKLLNRLSAIRSGYDSELPDLNEIRTILWEAQVHVVFPIIERTRRFFIETYNGDFLEVLPVKDEFGKQLDAPEDMELRHMWYYRFKEHGFRTQEDKQIFQLVYHARNILAHLDPVDSQALQKLLYLEE